jgi:hypothetical protein
MTEDTSNLIEADLVKLARAGQADLARCDDAVERVTLLRKRNALLALLKQSRTARSTGESDA